MSLASMYFDGVPPDLDVGHVYLELKPSGTILRAWTRTSRCVDPAVMPALQAWVDSEIAMEHSDLHATTPPLDVMRVSLHCS